MKGSLNAGLQPVWYIGAIDLPYAENKNILTVKAWSGIKQFVKVKVNLIPTELTPQQTSIIYASEADVLNMALFGMTAKQWRDKNPDKRAISGIMRV